MSGGDMDVQVYIKEANRQLSHTGKYQKLNIDPAELHIEKINNYKDVEQISSKTVTFLLHDKIKTIVFHLLPEIHKPDNPERPVISSVDCHTSRISEVMIITYSQ